MQLPHNKIVQFALLQCTAIALLFVLGLRGWPLAIAAGVCASLLSLIGRRVEWWWCTIHLAFPVLVVAMLEVKIEPAYFLVGFLLLAGFNWSAARTRVPYFPSGSVTWAAVDRVLADRPAVRFVDIGSGLGGLNFYLSKRHPQSVFTGVEISPLPWLASWFWSVLSRSACRFERRDYNELNLGEFDVVFAYLSPAVMPALWEKARREMKPGATLLSFEFQIPGMQPAEVIPAGMGGRPLYRWNIC